jgi:uncharacterized protein YqjF (DUF2071 family)
MSIFLKADWKNIIMANYAVPTAVLQPYLPFGTEIDVHNGKAYVSLVGFLFKKTRLFNIPIPYFGDFEEVNLRFYVIRKEGNSKKRGVVFINETIPYKPVAWLANKLYKEHYTVVPTKHTAKCDATTKTIDYFWKKNKQWMQLGVTAAIKPSPMPPQSFEAFIYEHYFGYTKINEYSTEEYKINHPSWNIHEVTKAIINCNFEKMYGPNFAFLQQQQPHSVFMAEGSAVSVEWKRRRILNPIY